MLATSVLRCLASCIATSFFGFWSLLEYIDGIVGLSRKKYINTDCVSYFYCGVNGGKRMMHDYKTPTYNLMVNQLYTTQLNQRGISWALSSYKRFSRSPLYHQPKNKTYKVEGKGRTKLKRSTHLVMHTGKTFCW